MNRLKRVTEYCKKNNQSLFSYFTLAIKYRWKMFVKKTKDKLRARYIGRPKQKRLKNIGPTIISINCVGGTISHDLGQKFNSPFVNVWLTAKDFLKYCENMDYYNNQELTFTKEEGYTHPIGLLDDIRIDFVHYKSEQESYEKWMERRKRINKDNMFILMTDIYTVPEDLERFDRLPFENKVLFTHRPMPNIKSSFYIKGFEDNGEVGILNNWQGALSIKRYYDQFDYVTWLNEGKLRRSK